MSPVLQDLKAAACGLPAGERAELALYLLHSLEDQGGEDSRAEWLALAERRMAEVRDGKVVGIAGEEVVKQLLEPRR
jgi:putative addiction module component (TIGR02574 family)